MKKVLQIVLAVVVVVLFFVLFRSILQPQRFERQVAVREAAVIERVKDIRTAEQAFKQMYGAYVGNFDELVDFVLNDSMQFVVSYGSDDSLSVATGRFSQHLVKVPVIDTIFSPRKLTREQVMQLPVIPFSQTEEYPEGRRFYLGVGDVETESGVIVPVFEARAPYNFYLHDLNPQLVSNMVDEDTTFGKYPGIKVGDLMSATNDAINRE
jgi:hypothetical protein